MLGLKTGHFRGIDVPKPNHINLASDSVVKQDTGAVESLDPITPTDCHPVLLLRD